MKTKNVILFLILFQFAFTLKVNAQCGTFTLYPTASYFDYGAATGRAVISIETLTRVEKRTLGVYDIECGDAIPSKQMVLKLYMSNSSTYDAGAVPVLVHSVYSNPTNIYTVDLFNKRYHYTQSWNDVSLNYTLPQGMSVCTFNAQI